MAGHAFGGRARARSLRRRVLRDRLMSDEVVPAAAGGLPYVSRPRTGTESRRRVARNRLISEQAVPATVAGWPRVSKPYTVTERRRRVLHDRLISEAVVSRYGWRLAVCFEAAYGHGALAPRVARPADIGAVVSRYGWRLAVRFEAAHGHGALGRRVLRDRSISKEAVSAGCRRQAYTGAEPRRRVLRGPAHPLRTGHAAAPKKKKAPEGAFNMLRLVRQAD